MSSGGASRCPCCWKPSPFRRAAATIRNPPRQDRTPYIAIRGIIARIALESGGAYGSPRIWLALRNRGIRVSEKAAACLMGQDRIEVLYTRRKRVRSSYVGEMTSAVENLVCGNFHAPRPDMLWSPDITEFSAGDVKVYLSLCLVK